jgi:quercetin dioxygenase-like cupin family protein
MTIKAAICALAMTAVVLSAGPTMADGNPEAAKPKVVPLLARDLPEFSGKEATLATVEYLPGGASRPHRHGAHVFVYVLEGSYATQVAGGERKVLCPAKRTTKTRPTSTSSRRTRARPSP